jgi:hypothetical protein
MELTLQEVGLLEELAAQDRTISGAKSRSGLDRLVEAGFVTEQALNISDTIYSITAAGREALAQMR